MTLNRSAECLFKTLISMYLLKPDHAPGEPLVEPFFPRALFGANLNRVHW